MTEEQAQQAVQDLTQRILNEGVAGDVVVGALLTYAILVSTQIRGPQDTARHLYTLAMQSAMEVRDHVN